MPYLIFGLHYVAFAVGLGCLFVQLSFLTRSSAEGSPRVLFLSRIDALFGIAALLSLVTGLLRIFLYGKGFAYYSTHLVFWAKMGMFAAIGIASIVPTIAFLKHRTLSLQDWRSNRPEQVARVVRLIRFEILVYFLIPFVAAALAHGPHF